LEELVNSVVQQSTINLNATTSTSALDITNINDVGVQIVVTTNANTGQFALQCSNDGTNFVTVTATPTISALAGSDVVILTKATDLPYKFFRVNFTIGTGTNGSAVITIFGKEV
jgi:hypothetical protein